jgi:chemotaxis protein MotA
MAEQPAKPKPVTLTPITSRPDLASIGGLVLSVGGILGGLLLEGGKIRDVAQITAALIVLGGTIGAVMVTTPLGVLVRAMQKLGIVFVEKSQQPQQAVDEIISFATKARKHGIVSLEQDADRVPDEFLRKALNLAVDGTDLDAIRKMMELEMSIEEHTAEAEAKVYEAAGGYAPTVGIIGAVLGLIQVMKHLENIDEVGRGIAVAFVATVYGVGSANLFFLPAANKLRARTHQATQIKELMLEGVVAIVEGLNPKLIRTKLEAYTREAAAPPSKAKTVSPIKPASAPAAAPRREAS